MTSLTVVDFNVERDRKSAVLHSELMRLDETHNPGAFTLQETSGYDDAVRKFCKDAGFGAFHGEGRGADESIILVRDHHKVTHSKFDAMGDGWWTVRGGHAPPRWFTKVLIDDWLALANVHLPPLGQHTPARFRAGPIGRLDDYGQMIDRCRIFLDVPVNARVIVGDWNVYPVGLVPHTPGWLRAKTDARIFATGPDDIDYALGKRCRVNVRTDHRTKETSDHEPKVLVVSQHTEQRSKP